MLRLLEREALLSQFAVYLDATKTDESALVSAASPFADVIEQLDVFLVVGSRERWQTGRRLIAVQLPKSDTAAQRELWQKALAGAEHSLDGELEALVQQFCFGPETIRRTIAAAQDFAAMHSSKKNVELTKEDLWRACREQTGWRLDELAQPVIPCHGWEDIGLGAPSNMMRLFGNHLKPARPAARQEALRMLRSEIRAAFFRSSSHAARANAALCAW